MTTDMELNDSFDHLAETVLRVKREHDVMTQALRRIVELLAQRNHHGQDAERCTSCEAVILAEHVLDRIGDVKCPF